MVSDSVLMLGNGEYAINREGNSMKTEEILARINKEKKASFMGTVTFGRKEGSSMFSITTYCDIPLANEISSSEELNISFLNKGRDLSKDIETGFIKYSLDSEGKIVRKKIPKMNHSQFETARPHISGMTSEVLDFISKTMNFESIHSKELRSVISEKPFNTFAFYHLKKQVPEMDNPEFYRKLVQNKERFFNIFGGNCSLFSLFLSEKLIEAGLEPKIGLFNSNKPDDKEGHSAIFTEEDGINYLFEPGLSIPYPVPFSREISISPFCVDNKKIIVNHGFFANCESVPEIDILTSRNRKSGVRLNLIMSPEAYTEKLPEILSRLHDKRDVLKMDFHSQDGKKEFHISLDINENNLKVGFGNGKYIDVHPHHFKRDINVLEQMKILCHAANIDHRIVVAQILGSIALLLE